MVEMRKLLHASCMFREETEAWRELWTIDGCVQLESEKKSTHERAIKLKKEATRHNRERRKGERRPLL